MTVLNNSFSLGMLHIPSATIKVTELSLEEAKEILGKGFTSAVGHQSTSEVFANMLGVPVPMARLTLKVDQGDILIVGQYTGPRLEEGVKVLPEGAKITWIKVVVSYE